MRYFIFGLQRSGTNFLEQTMNQNFGGNKQNRHNKCWKHFIDPPEGWTAQEATIVVYKNPYTWVESICFRNTVDWIKTQRVYPALEGPDDLKLGPKNINVEALAKTYLHWQNKWVLNPNKIDGYDKNVFIIKYEDMLVDEKRNEIMDRIWRKFNGNRKNINNWIVPQPGRVSQSSDYNKQREQYYKQARPEKLEQKHINCINNIIGVDNIRKLGYDIL